MEYNTEKNVNEIKKLMSFIVNDAKTVLEGIAVQADNDTLDTLWRLCEMMNDYAERARVLIGKMSDEREDRE